MVKTLTIRDDVYDKLATLKREGESFSQLFERLATDRSSVDRLKSMRGSMKFRDAADKEEFLREVTSKRGEVRR